MKKNLGLLALLVLFGIGAWWWHAGVARDTGDASIGLVFIPLEEDLAGFARATEPGAIRFPDDLGAHDAYQTEWWYYTGNLVTEDNRRFGFQLTFFRRALAPLPDDASKASPLPRSNWRTNQVYLAHFALSDIDGGRFYHQEMFSRGAAGLAGARSEPYAVWLNNWHARGVAPGVVRLHAKTDDVTLDLELTQTLPPVLHGDEGLSAKGPEPGNASHYYSIVRQETAGRVMVDGKVHEVTGLSWKDHEYSSSVLDPGTVGWDWFSLQFDDGTAMMLFQIRHDDGTIEPASSGSFVYADGTVQPLSLSDWHLKVTEKWTSPATRATYPVGWNIRLETLDMEISGRAMMLAQELTGTVTYWEGAVAFGGRRAGQEVRAEGYVELTGYAETMAGRL